MRRVLLATHNAGKVREIRAMTAGQEIEWLSLADFPAVPEAIESGATFQENARIKAAYYATQTDLPALAEDSGLEVDGLGGEPGIHSARFAGEPRDDRRNNQKLIAKLRERPGASRAARFVSAMALADRNGTIHVETTGALHGQIIDEPRGSGGFGYDPLFYLAELGRTSAELSSAEKNRVSHRGQALRQMLAKLAVEQPQACQRAGRPL